MYDARAKTDAVSTTRQIVFACVGVGFAIGALALAFMWPTANDRAQARLAQYQLNLNRAEAGLIALAMPDLEVADFQSSLLELDRVAYARLETRLKNSRTQTQAIRIVSQEVESIVSNHGDLLARADVRHFDTLLKMTRNTLSAASEGGNKWCRGSQYVTIPKSANPERAAVALSQEFTTEVPEAGQYVVDVMTLLFQAAIDARHNNHQRGPLTTIDKAAIQGVMFSLIGDPQISRAIQAAETGQNPETVLINMDVCSLGGTIITAITTLPQSTKGQLWTELMRGGEDLRKLSPN